MKSQDKTILNYRVILKPDDSLGEDNLRYVAFCPTLGVVDDGDTTQEAMDNIKKTISFHLECLKEEDKEIPVDNLDEEMIANTQISFSYNPLTRFAI